VKPTGSQTAYTIVLISEHNQGLHFESPHEMCRLCHPEEAKLLDQLKDEGAES
jgi:hypothetical protein